MKKITCGILCLILICLMGCTWQRGETFTPLNKEQLSIENRDYVVNITVKEEKELNFVFEIADLSQYQGSSSGGLSFTEYKCSANNIKEAIAKYYGENERQLDLGHVEKITIDEVGDGLMLKALFIEISNMPGVTKSTKVIFPGDNNSEIILRELIKKIYAGEEFNI